MAVKHIAFTMYPVKDMARARAFYEQGVGLETPLVHGGGKWVEYHLQNGAFAITTMSPVAPSARHGGSIAFEVDELAPAVAKAKAAGATSKVERFESPVCWMAVLVDPEGNAFTLHQKKP